MFKHEFAMPRLRVTTVLENLAITFEGEQQLKFRTEMTPHQVEGGVTCKLVLCRYSRQSVLQAS